MKQNEKLITVLNKILVDELSIINRNMSLSKVINELGQDKIEKETSEEFKQAEWLIKRIIFLEVCREYQKSRNINQSKYGEEWEKIRSTG